MMTPSGDALPGPADGQQHQGPVRRPLPTVGGWGLTGAERALLGFVAEMYGVQLDQLAVLLTDCGVPADSAGDRASELLDRWRAGGYADCGNLTVGEPWVWATRKGLDACGLRTRLIKPSAHLLRHTHAVTEVRLAVERTSSYQQSGASWRSERSLLAGEFPSRTGHVPDGEVRYPAGSGLPWAGETWAVEVEISRKSVERTAAIMQEILRRTTGYRPSPADGLASELPPLYARLVYACSAASVQAVLEARAEVGPPESARIDVYDLPESATRLQAPGWRP
jgi:hypothetical protein